MDISIFAPILWAALFIAVTHGVYSYFLSSSTDKQPKPWTAIEAITITVAAYIITQIAGGILFGIYLAATGTGIEEVENSTALNFLFSATVNALLFASVYWFIKRRQISLKSLGVTEFKWEYILYALSGFAIYIPLNIVTVALASELIPALDIEQQQELGFSASVDSVSLVAVFISLVIIPPLVEEFICRGFLYSGLRKKYSFWPAAIIVSILFAIAHLQLGSGNPPLWVAAIDTFILSIILVGLRQKTGSLWPSVGLHAIKNGLAYFMLFIVPKLSLLG